MSESDLRLRVSPGFKSWLGQEQVSVAFTTYQANHLFLVGLQADGEIAVCRREFERPMGLWASSERLFMSARWQLWQFDNALPEGALRQGYDRIYVPRVSHTTGGLDVHDIGVDSDGRVIFVNTAYSCLATTSERWSFKPLWQPPFISGLEREDRCHLNGMAMSEGQPAYVTVVSRSDVARGWREERRDGGCVIDVATGDVVVDGLSMPHSPRVHRGRLWLLNSGTGELGTIERDGFQGLTFCPGFLRGLAFQGDAAVVGLSKQRDHRAFAGLALDDYLKSADEEARCGIYVIDTRSGMILHTLELDGPVTELYDVQVIPGARCPTALGFKFDDIHLTITIDTDSGPIFQRPESADEPAEEAKLVGRRA